MEKGMETLPADPHLGEAWISQVDVTCNVLLTPRCRSLHNSTTFVEDFSWTALGSPAEVTAHCFVHDEPLRMGVHAPATPGGHGPPLTPRTN